MSIHHDGHVLLVGVLETFNNDSFVFFFLATVSFSGM